MILQKAFYVVRFRNPLPSFIRKLWFSLQGLRVGKGTYLSPCYITWPHQVSLGENCFLERGSFFKFDGPWKPGPKIIVGDRVFIGKDCEFNIKEGIIIGRDCMIASGVKFIDHNHGMKIGLPMARQQCYGSSIILEEDIWIGCNSIILEGVRIGKGAVIGAGSIVNSSIPSNEIWTGVPAKKIGMRS